MMPHHADTDYERWCNTSERYQVAYAAKGTQADGSPAVCVAAMRASNTVSTTV